MEKDTKKNKQLINKILENALNPRKTQEDFTCPCCEHKQNADQQAGLNIARRWLFIGSPEHKKYKSGQITYWQAWENFYKRKIKENWE